MDSKYDEILKLDSIIIIDFDLNSEYKPELILFEQKNKKEIRIPLKFDDELNWYVHPDRYCVGYHLYDEYHSYNCCPYQSKLDKGFQCESCKARDLLIPCMLCKGDECYNIKSVKDHCDTTLTSVYLVTFGNQIKVGVSKKDRLLKRWIEQGAELAAEVALLPNGLKGRAVEEAVSNEFLVTKGIQLKMKLSRVAENMNDIMNKNEFSNVITRVSEWISKKYGQESVGECQIKDLNSHYNTVKGATRLDTNSNVSLKGKFVGMKGPIFLITSFGQYFFFDMRNLRGRKIGNAPAQGSSGLLSDFF